MIERISQKTIVSKAGKVVLPSTELPEGTLVEVAIRAETPPEVDETSYLLRSEANKQQQFRALESVKQGNLIMVNLDKHGLPQ